MKIILLVSVYVKIIFPFVTKAEDCTRTRCKLKDPSLRFLTIGDWGGMPVWPYETLAQSRVSKALSEIAKSKRTHFQISTGDNFYTHGVEDVWDHRFQDTFEKVYTSQYLRTPWYIVGGNHDHYGNISAQVAYTKRSSRWEFPNNYYKVQYELPDSTKIDILMIDTIVLCGNLKPVKNADFFTYMSAESSEQPVLLAEDRAASERHWTWLQNNLRNSDANYLFVTGHFPVYSIGGHGPTQCLVDRLLPLLWSHGVSAYLSGHDHNLQHLKARNPSGRSETVNFVVSGMAGYKDSSQEHIHAVPSGSLKFHYPDSDSHNWLGKFFTRGGFVYTSLDKNQAVFNYYRGDQTLLYQFTLLPRS